ncbi:MAG: type II toxin-antitoxin system RelE/ParE family toxin [Candidatus Rokubacteria bacterium]|nr:type II toxin-antitoxin system RelE/ParE family toxin [Candidatus Rokubacteria bacterium]
MADLRWSLTAEEDLRAIEDFIAKDSVLHAVHFVDRLIEAAEQLTHAPKIGRVVPEFNRDDLRELLFRAYRIVYQLRGETVTVLRVVHGARDLARLMRRESWIVE